MSSTAFGRQLGGNQSLAFQSANPYAGNHNQDHRSANS